MTGNDSLKYSDSATSGSLPKRHFSEHIPKSDEFYLMVELVEFLRELKNASETWEADKTPTIHLVIRNMCGIKYSIEEYQPKLNSKVIFRACNYPLCSENRSMKS